jgi:hypothetical protein
LFVFLQFHEIKKNPSVKVGKLKMQFNKNKHAPSKKMSLRYCIMDWKHSVKIYYAIFLQNSME